MDMDTAGRHSELLKLKQSYAHNLIETVPADMHRITGNIEFRFIDETVPTQVIDVEIAGRKYPLDAVNTYIHDKQSRFITCQEVLGLPRFSTIANGYIISQLVNRMPRGTAYLNIGVWYGFTFLAALVDNPDKICIGVDNFSQFGGPVDVFNHHYDLLKSPLSQFYNMDYLEYFAKIHTQPLGVYFYDGEHSYENQLKALEVAEPFYQIGTYLVVDDTNDPGPYQATMDFMAPRLHQYRVVIDKKTPHNAHPTYWNGLLILQKIS